MDSKYIAVTEGAYGPHKPAARRCTRCGGAARSELWTSECGRYEDVSHICLACGRRWRTKHIEWQRG